MTNSGSSVSKDMKIVYPPGCKEISDSLGKDELVRRFKLLARAFQDMGQDDSDDHVKYAPLALEIATGLYMDHTSKDVRILVACCIADVFRIFAPDAPYRDPAHLKEIFMFMNKQMYGLEDPASPSFKRYFYLLENLACVKSFNICIELEDNQEIFCALFKAFFTIVNDKHSSKVKNFMLDMMTPLIVDADFVSQELLDLILMNIIEPQKSQNKVLYSLAKEVIRRTSTSLEPYIQMFFNNSLMMGKSSESDVSEHLYSLIYELNQIAPSVLFAVLPQLEFKLKSNEEEERKQVTKLLSKMFSDLNSDLAVQNKLLWNCFLGRFNDISITVRRLCVTASQQFLLNHPELTKDVTEQLKIRQHDPEESVRMEVVNTILHVAKKDFTCCSAEMLGFLKERTLDKKFKIRREALLGLGHLYKTIMSRDHPDKELAERIAWVKDKVFHAYYQNAMEDRLLVERIFNICLVPYTLNVDDRMRKLYHLYATLDDYAVKAFNEMLKHRNNVRNLVCQLADAHEKIAQGQSVPVAAKLTGLLRNLPDSGKAPESLKKFNSLLKEDKRLRQHLQNLVSPDCTSKKAEDHVKEILKRIGNPAPSQNHQQNTLYSTVKALLERTASVMIDTQAVVSLVRHVNEAISGLGTETDGIDKAAEKGVRLLLALAYVFPNYCKSKEVFETLLPFLRHDDDVIADITLQIFTCTGQNIQDSYPNIYSALVPVLQNAAKMGNPKQTKHAIRCIKSVVKNKELPLRQVFDTVKNHITIESANYLTAIVAVGHIAQLCPEEFASEMRNIVTKKIVEELLMVDRARGPITTESWYNDFMVTEETQAKVQSMKLLVRWLLGLKSNEDKSVSSTVRLLYTVIIHEGDLMEKGKINKPELARLRLQAGCCMLKLAEESCYRDIITKEQFQALALLMNDSCFHVRVQFAAKLHKGLLSMRLPLEYMSIFSLAANDPSRERKAQIKQFLIANINKRKELLKQNPNAADKMFHILPDYVLPYTIHLLAHDPDLKTYDHMDALKNIKECLWMVMDPLINRSEDYNYVFVRRLVENIKQTKDAQAPDDEEANKKLYAVCDIALLLIQNKSTNVTLKDTNIRPTLPAKFFTNPDMNHSNTQIYLPKDFDAKRKGAPMEMRKVSAPADSIVEPLVPVVSSNPTVPAKGRRRRRENPDSDLDIASSTGRERNLSGDSAFSNTSNEHSFDSSVNKSDVSDISSSPPSTAALRGRRKPEDSVKPVTKQPKITEFKAGRVPARKLNVKKSSDSKTAINGTKSKEAPKRQTRSQSETPSSMSSQSSSARKRTAQSDEENTPSKRPKSDSGKQTNVVRNLRTEMSDINSGKSSPRSSQLSSSTKAQNPTKSTKQQRLTRQLQSSQESSPASDNTSPIPKTTQRNAIRQQKDVLKKNSKQDVNKNVRKGKTLTNGTSDGEDSTDTDIPTPRTRTAALTKAIESIGMEESPVKRSTRGRKK